MPAFTRALTCTPEEHARNHHTLLFKHAKKFSTTGPSGIAFVHFPWSGEKLFPIGDGNRRFFRRFAEEFFYTYSATTRLAKDFNDDFQTSMTAGEVASHLSLILFLEDHTITATNPNSVNVTANYLFNKAAKHTLIGSALESYFQARKATDLSITV